MWGSRESHASVKRQAENLVTGKYPEFRRLLPELTSHLDEFGHDPTEDQLLRKLNDLHLEEELEPDGRTLLDKTGKGEFDQATRNSFSITSVVLIIRRA